MNVNEQALAQGYELSSCYVLFCDNQSVVYANSAAGKSCVGRSVELICGEEVAERLLHSTEGQELTCVTKFRGESCILSIRGGSPSRLIYTPVESAYPKLYDRQSLQKLSSEMRSSLADIYFALQKLKDTEENGCYWELAEQGCYSILHIAENISDYARYTDPQFAPQLVRVDLVELCVDQLEQMKGIFELEGVTVELMKPEQPLVSLLDRTMIKQLLSNLLSNALRVTTRRGHIRITLRAMGGRNCITILDQGGGVDVENMIPMFFSFAENGIPRANSNFGVGMSLCMLICQAHGGTLLFENVGGEKPGLQVTASLSAAVGRELVFHEENNLFERYHSDSRRLLAEFSRVMSSGKFAKLLRAELEKSE